MINSEEKYTKLNFIILKKKIKITVVFPCYNLFLGWLHWVVCLQHLAQDIWLSDSESLSGQSFIDFWGHYLFISKVKVFILLVKLCKRVCLICFYCNSTEHLTSIMRVFSLYQMYKNNWSMMLLVLTINLSPNK